VVCDHVFGEVSMQRGETSMDAVELSLHRREPLVHTIEPDGECDEQLMVTLKQDVVGVHAPA
jgi:hypothetical protein